MEKPMRITIWGTSRAGKTVYLIALYWDFQRRRGEWRIAAEDAESEAFLDAAREDFFVHHRFPDKTHQIRIYRYRITRMRDSSAFTLAFIDAPGELYNEYYDITPEKKKRGLPVDIPLRDRQDQVSEVTPQAMFERLTTSDGILTMLDPGWKLNPRRSQPYDQMLAQVFRDLAKSGAAPYVALCYSKVDASDALWQFVIRRADSSDTAHRFNPLHDCYRFHGRDGTDDNPCAENCKIYEELGSKLMEDQLELPDDHFACFHLSSIGRINDKLNVGSLYQWEREEILALRPPAFHLLQDGSPELPPHLASLAEPLDNVQVNETFEPFSINKPNDISPYHVIDPILWLIDRIEQR